jgi:hypothetical protein
MLQNKFEIYGMQHAIPLFLIQYKVYFESIHA